jgi:DNA (cytosine-5)-methyltransferase 1
VKSVELFVGAGGLALGIGNAGFVPEAVVEWNHHACETIRLNQRNGLGLVKAWPLREMDVAHLDYATFSPNVELVSGGPPCQPFSLGGKHQGYNDKRDMFPQAIRAVRELQPSCFIFENVKGLTRRAFTNYLEYIRLQLTYPEVTRNADEGWQDHLYRLERHYTQGGCNGLQYKVMMELLMRLG